MHHLCSLSSIATFSTKSLFLFNPNKSTCTNDLTFGVNGIIRTIIQRRRSSNKWWIISSSMENESDYEVDSDKAKQALSELDQQFESISTRQLNTPKIKASSIERMTEEVKNENNELPEITGSFLGYTTFVLFLFSIFYNILFMTVIKPSIDGPDEDIVDVTTSYQVSSVN